MNFLRGCWLLWLSLSGCGTSTAPSNTVQFGLSSAPITLDPRFATDAASTYLNRLLYQRLIEFDAQAKPVPSLADWQQLSPIHYRFRLLEPAPTFVDGQALNVNDVKATYDFVLDPANASPHRGSLTPIDHIDIHSPTEIDFWLKQADSLFVSKLVVGIVPAQAIQSQRPLNQQPLGSGTFAFVAWPVAEKLLLKRRKDSLQIRFLTVKDPVVRALKLLRGELDLIQGSLSPELVTWLRQQPTLRVQQAQGNYFSYLGFNLEDKTTRFMWLRQAVGHALDRAAIMRHLMQNTVYPAQSILPPDHWAGDAHLPDLVYDLAKAKQLLAVAGYSPENPLHLSYKTSTDPFRLRVATVIKHQLKQVGIELHIDSHDWGTFYADIKQGRFQMYSLSWVGVKTPDIFYYAFHSASIPPDGANRGRLRDSQIDQWIQLADASPDAKQQAAYYRQIQARLLSLLPYVPLWYESNVLVTNHRVHHAQLNRDGDYDYLDGLRFNP
jgi:peptide/nickel transport system substrate-binding protein